MFPSESRSRRLLLTFHGVHVGHGTQSARHRTEVQGILTRPHSAKSHAEPEAEAAKASCFGAELNRIDWITG